MKKYKIIINITNNFLVFWPDYCTHIRVISPIILSPSSSLTKAAVVRLKKAITPQKMIKRGSKKDMTDFLQMPDKLFSKKKRQINKSKQKVSIEEISSRKATINSLDISNKNKLPVLLAVIITSKSKTKDIPMISTDDYCAACYLKKVQVFHISMRNIQYQTKKKTRAETNPKCVVPQEYHNFLNVFSKKDLDTLFLHQKYDHKIYLEKKYKPNHVSFYKMSFANGISTLIWPKNLFKQA